MNVQTDKPCMIFVKEYNGKKYNKVGLSRKKQDGTYENGYVDIQFKQGIEFENKDQIYIKDAFLTFYKSKDKATIPYIFVMEFERLEDTIKHSKETDIVKQDTKDDFEEFGKEFKLDDMEITDDDLPF